MKIMSPNLYCSREMIPHANTNSEKKKKKRKTKNGFLKKVTTISNIYLLSSVFFKDRKLNNVDSISLGL